MSRLNIQGSFPTLTSPITMTFASSGSMLWKLRSLALVFDLTALTDIYVTAGVYNGSNLIALILELYDNTSLPLGTNFVGASRGSSINVPWIIQQQLSGDIDIVESDTIQIFISGTFTITSGSYYLRLTEVPE